MRVRVLDVLHGVYAEIEEGNDMFSLLYSSNGVEEANDIREYLIDSENDLEFIPSDAAPGSIAYLPDLSSIWMKSNTGIWTLITG